MHAIRVCLCLCLVAGPVSAAEPDATKPRFSLHNASTEPAPQQSGRYALRARFQREERAGELREGGGLVLIGRFAKASVGCNADTVFRNGFEG